jgi:MipA family protein
MIAKIAMLRTPMMLSPNNEVPSRIRSATSISPAQSAATVLLASTTGLPPLPAYAASGGLYSYGAGTQVLYRFDPQWEARTFIEYKRLTGSAADSPLVTQRGSANQLTYGVGATYSFNMRSWW